MERKGGCCLVPRYGAAAAAQHQQTDAAWRMGRIMLKFRPIAPKPAAMAPAPAPTTTVAGPAVGSAGRRKRKAVCRGGGSRGRKPRKAATAAVVTPAPALPAAAAAAAQDVGDCRKACEKEKSSSSRSSSSSSSGMTSVDSSPPSGPQQHLATLPLMHVAPVEDKAAAVGAAAEVPAAPAPSQTQVAAPDAAWARPFAPRAMPRPAAATAAASSVTVEEVTATWRDCEAPAPCVGPGADDAPAFVSDQWGRVTWRNATFVRAASVCADDGGGEAEEAPPVVLSGTLPAWGTCAGFTCRVRVRQSSSARRVGSSVVAPCDVWRLDAAGSYMWRLDLQAALTLGGRL